jgi:exonuclease III
LTDDRGERWTHHWGNADIYSRIDYILVNRRLEEDIDSARSGIARPPYWREASDHCPVFVSIKPPAS